MHVLGIDAGGTKTVCLLADEAGVILSAARGAGANLQTAGELAVEKVLHQVMDAALAAHPEVPAAICLGIAGADRPADRATIGGIMRRLAFKARVLVVNDALVALTAGAEDGAGIVLIAGTGSICYGRDDRGRAARSGGWGHVLGDEGSGYWIGRRALGAVMQQADGRGPATALTAGVLSHFGVSAPSDLVREIYYREAWRTAVAALGGVVDACATAGDALAVRIVDDAADELALMVRPVARRLGLHEAAVPLILAGGLFRGMAGLRAAVERRLAGVVPKAMVRLLRDEPAVGAVRLALAEARGGAAVPTYIEGAV